MIRIGTGEKNITPAPGLELCGYIARIQPSLGIYDDLYARILYHEDANSATLWIHCDLIGFSNAIARRLKNVAALTAGINSTSIFLSATHTHSGPATVPLRNCGDIDAGYLKFLEKQIIDGVLEAVNNQEYVTMLYSETNVKGVAIDRRAASVNTHIDEKMPLVAFQREDGTYKALIANYGMHNVGLTERNRHISADIAGYAVRFASSAIPGNPTILLTNGACGNINPSVMSDDYSGVEELGTVLGNKLIGEIHNLQISSEADVSSSLNLIDIDLEVLTIEQINRIMEQHQKEFETGEKNYVNNRLIDTLRLWAEETISLIRNGSLPDTVTAYIHILRFGMVYFVGINAEVFSKMPTQLRKLTGISKLYIVGYANGCFGYLFPEEIYDEGGYEADSAYKFYGYSRVKVGGYESIRDEVASLIMKDSETFSKMLD